MGREKFKFLSIIILTSTRAIFAFIFLYQNFIQTIWSQIEFYANLYAVDLEGKTESRRRIYNSIEMGERIRREDIPFSRVIANDESSRFRAETGQSYSRSMSRPRFRESGKEIGASVCARGNAFDARAIFSLRETRAERNSTSRQRAGPGHLRHLGQKSLPRRARRNKAPTARGRRRVSFATFFPRALF